MGRRGAVEVPRGRLGRPLSRAARRGDRHAVVGEPTLRAGRPGAPSRRPRGRGSCRSADRCGPRPRPASARNRRRRRPGRLVHGRRVPYLGGSPDGRRVRGTGQHPRFRRHRRRTRGDVRGDRDQPARGATPRQPRRRAGRRRRQSGAAVRSAPRRRAGAGIRGALGRSRRSPRRRSRAAARGAPSPVRPPPGALRTNASLPLDHARRRASSGGRRSPRGSRLRTARGLGRRSEPRGARRRRGRDRSRRTRRAAPRVELSQPTRTRTCTSGVATATLP